MCTSAWIQKFWIATSIHYVKESLLSLVNIGTQVNIKTKSNMEKEENRNLVIVLIYSNSVCFKHAVLYILPDNEWTAVEYRNLDYSINDYDITRGLHIDRILYKKNLRVPFLLLINNMTVWLKICNDKMWTFFSRCLSKLNAVFDTLRNCTWNFSWLNRKTCLTFYAFVNKCLYLIKR